MKIAVCPGSFDPITFGHLDIVRRASGMFDRVIVAVLKNSAKQCTFSVAERVAMIEDSVRGLPNVTAASFDGLLADYTRIVNASVIVKGLRAMSDFEYEFQMALINQKINPDVETVFLSSRSEYMFMSSNIVREIARVGGDISQFVPEVLIDRIHNKYIPK
mgnify:CR=1 FL=1